VGGGGQVAGALKAPVYAGGERGAAGGADAGAEAAAQGSLQGAVVDRSLTRHAGLPRMCSLSRMCTLSRMCSLSRMLWTAHSRAMQGLEKRERERCYLKLTHMRMLIAGAGAGPGDDAHGTQMGATAADFQCTIPPRQPSGPKPLPLNPISNALSLRVSPQVLKKRSYKPTQKRPRRS
jgi:hypothetical protein